MTDNEGRRKGLRSSHAQVVDKLGLAIIRGEYEIGSILPGDKILEQQFGVSRTVLREATKTLTAKGLITARARVGTWVQPRENWNMMDSDILDWHFKDGTNEKLLMHLSDACLSILPHAAQLAAKSASSDVVEKLNNLLGQLGSKDLTADEMSEIDSSFHLTLLEASDNPVMQSADSMVKSALTGFYSYTVSSVDSETIDKVIDYHRKVVNAIEDNDEDSARTATENMIHFGRDCMLYIEANKNEPDAES